ncbi:hypothetical protein C1H46_002893 [Malus baccata]|uniref:Uncharacterized protein n=1 Tax=Malus baccata TaxID=106549 RepID=A0A540NKF9_MALBA|nr:hypothetical protein C1H46_002893 [Malus baccata]
MDSGETSVEFASGDTRTHLESILEAAEPHQAPFVESEADSTSAPPNLILGNSALAGRFPASSCHLETIWYTYVSLVPTSNSYSFCSKLSILVFWVSFKAFSRENY